VEQPPRSGGDGGAIGLVSAGEFARQHPGRECDVVDLDVRAQSPRRVLAGDEA
jgi:hypothetical protein